MRLAAPLTAITAAVVGVIASLALYFGSHVFWNGAAGFDSGAALIGLAALASLTVFRVGVIPVIGASALAGVLAWMAGT